MSAAEIKQVNKDYSKEAPKSAIFNALSPLDRNRQ